jgi:hypothetical protein
MSTVNQMTVFDVGGGYITHLPMDRTELVMSLSGGKHQLVM